MARPKHMRSPPVRELMRRLRKNEPLSKPLRLVQRRNPTCAGERVLGYAAYRVRRGRVVSFRIVVEERLTLGEKFDVIIHEYAHCLDRDGRRARWPKDCHDARWGQAYSRAFRASLPAG